MWVLLEPAVGVGDADKTQQLDRALVGGGPVHAAMLLKGFGNLAADRQNRV